MKSYKAYDTEQVPWGWLFAASSGGSIGGALLVRWLIPITITTILRPPQQGLDVARVEGMVIIALLSTGIGCFIGAGIAGSIGWLLRTLLAEHRVSLVGWETWCAFGGGMGTFFLLVIGLILGI